MPGSLPDAIDTASRDLEPGPLLASLARHACDLFGADRASVAVVDPGSGSLRTAAAWPPANGREPGDGADGAGLTIPVRRQGREVGAVTLRLPPGRSREGRAALRASFAEHAAAVLESAGLLDRARHRLDNLQLLYETSRRISVALDMAEMIAAYVEHVAAGSQYFCTVALDEYGDSGEREMLVIHARWVPGTGTVRTAERHPYQSDLDSTSRFQDMLDAGKTVTIDDTATDPRVSPALREMQKRANRPALALIPLIARGQRIGLVFITCAAAHRWEETELRPYQATAVQLAAAVDSRRQLARLAERERQLAVLEERQRIARDLHDSVTQLLFSTTLLAQSLGAAWQRDAGEGERRTARLLELCQAAQREMRGLLTELRPASEAGAEAASAPEGLSGGERARRRGLADAVGAHVAALCGEGIEAVLDAARYAPQESALEEALFHIVQEAVNNTVKHAGARRITIRLRAARGRVTVGVRDDGSGFVLEAAPAGGGQLGLAIMRERAEGLGGRLRVRTAPGRGTRVVARVPAPGGGG